MKKPVRYYAKVCIFLLPGADMSKGRLEKDFQIAREIWGFDFDLTVIKFDTNPMFSNLTSIDFTCEGSGDSAVEQQLYQLKSTYSPDNRIIGVVYTGTNSIAGSARACTKRRRIIDPATGQPTFINMIFISNTVAPDTLAHEIGHTFFFSHPIDRRDADLNLPGIQNHVEGDPGNVMAPGYIRTYPTTATPEQIRRAIESNSPQVIFERPGPMFGDAFPPRKSRDSKHGRWHSQRYPYDGQSWPGYYQ